MQYSDELIKQELTRYNTSNQPGDVSDDEVQRWKATFINLDNERIEEAFNYIHGRSWYWRKLMQSIDMPSNSKVEDVLNIAVPYPEFEIGIQVAMRQMGKPIEDKIEILEDSKIEEIKESESEKPKIKKVKKAVRK